MVAAVQRRLRQAVARRLAVVGLTPGRMRALRRLGTDSGPIRMGELAASLGVVPRTATTLVDELAESGLVARVADAEDRRATRIELTAAGRQMLDSVQQIRAEAAAEVLGGLGRGELGDLRDLLSRVPLP